MSENPERETGFEPATTTLAKWPTTLYWHDELAVIDDEIRHRLIDEERAGHDPGHDQGQDT